MSQNKNPAKSRPANKKMAKHPRKNRKRQKDDEHLQRCFIGLAFPLYDALEPLRNELGKLENDEHSFRITAAENLHITLKFLGSLSKEKLPEIKAVAAAICQNFSLMKLQCQGIGVFKQSLWVGIEKDQQLTELAAALNQAAQGQGIALDDKDFLPHVTVARFGKNSKAQLSPLLEKYQNTHWGEFAVMQAHLFLSQTRPEGATYTIIKNFPFKPDSDS